ncbi:nuclear transport factor 2 family protein [Streptomyces sp. NPDC056697]|uniref:nuclear transport factor 2 family protein n=1 Tax=Streptomyces sp. NPDC056697 TaxID=3345915 RepID=UPI00369F4DFB
MPESSTNITVVDNFFRAVERGDVDAVRGIYASDVAIWHNDGAGDQGLEDNLVVLGLLGGAIHGMRFDVTRRADVGAGVFQQHVLRGQLSDGEQVGLDAAMYIAVNDRKITRIEEYFDVATVRHLIKAAKNATDEEV